MEAKGLRVGFGKTDVMITVVDEGGFRKRVSGAVHCIRSVFVAT